MAGEPEDAAQPGADRRPQGRRHEATVCLTQVAGGDRSARNRLFDLVYAELRSQAAACLQGERSDHTLQATALVHEAWLRLIDQERVEAKSRGHFLALAAMAMRRILVDHARARGRSKRGGSWRRVEAQPAELVRDEEQDGLDSTDLVAIDRALATLHEQSERMAQIVELRFFGGLSREEVAEALDISPSTVKREWRAARALMTRLLAATDEG